MPRQPSPSDVRDDEWAFVAPDLTLMTEAAPQRDSALREVFTGLRWRARSGAQWRMMPNAGPPWHAVYQQTQRWLKAQVFEAIGHDLRMLVREVLERMLQPRAAIFDARTRQARPDSGDRAGGDSQKRRKGSKVHSAVATRGQLLTVLVPPANEQERAQIGELAEPVQAGTGESVEIGLVDQGDTDEQIAEQAAAHGIRLAVVKLPDANNGFVLLPRRWWWNAALGGWPVFAVWLAAMSACPKPLLACIVLPLPC